MLKATISPLLYQKTIDKAKKNAEEARRGHASEAYVLYLDGRRHTSDTQLSSNNPSFNSP